jgi:hypothetical protein
VADPVSLVRFSDGPASKRALVLIGATGLGLAIGFGLAIGQEVGELALRFGAISQVQQELQAVLSGGGLQALGMLYGLGGKGYRLDLPALRQRPLPLILFWEFNHFVVLEGFRGKRVALNDLATGRRYRAGCGWRT